MPSLLPKTVTKERLLNVIQRKLVSCTRMFWDDDATAQQMYEELSCSIFSGDPEVDFPDEVKAEQDSVIRYQYNGGGCFFIVDDIKVDVFDLRDMRNNSYVDVCIPAITYTDDDGTGCFMHPIPDAWLYGSASPEFNEGHEVHPEFIAAARDFIKLHHITKDMQKYFE